jgi:hypothetical protein
METFLLLFTWKRDPPGRHEVASKRGRERKSFDGVRPQCPQTDGCSHAVSVGEALHKSNWRDLMWKQCREEAVMAATQGLVSLRVSDSQLLLFNNALSSVEIQPFNRPMCLELWIGICMKNPVTLFQPILERPLTQGPIRYECD